MRSTLKHHILKLVFLLTFSGFRCLAETPVPATIESPGFSVDDNFQRGWHELNVGGGDMFSNIIRGDKRPLIDYALFYVQPAYTLTQPGGDNFFRGSLQLAPEISGAYVYRGPGSYVASAIFWLRYDFVPRGWRFVPYLQGGFGATMLDIPENFDGKSFNYNLEAAVGLRYFIRPKCALNLEYRLQHISNANMWMHNVGVNTTGPVAGVSFFF